MLRESFGNMMFFRVWCETVFTTKIPARLRCNQTRISLPQSMP